MLVQEAGQLGEILRELRASPAIALDTETSGLNYCKDKIVGISVAWEAGREIKTAYLPVAHPANFFSANLDRKLVQDFLRRLLDFRPYLCFHTCSFDLHFLRQLLPSFDLDPRRFLDVAVLARMTGQEAQTKDYRPSLRLFDLHQEHLGNLDPETLAWWSRGKRQRSEIGKLPADVVGPYAEMDARATLELAFALGPALHDPLTRQLWEVEARFIRLLISIEENGIPLSRPFVETKIREFEARRQRLAQELMREGLANPGSTKEVGIFLSKTLALPPLTRTATNQISVAVPVHKAYHSHPLVAKLIEWRHLGKAISSWLTPFLEQADNNGYLHPSFDPAGTVSARISCRSPNLQAVPISERDNLVYGSLRGIFTAPPGASLIQLDYKQADLRLATCYARENRMAQALASGDDPYLAMAQQIWGRSDDAHRSLAKRFSLATINAIGAGAAARNFGIPEREAHEVLQRHRKTYPGFVRAGRYCERFIERNHFIRLWTGRELFLQPDEESHKAFSRLVQGGVAEMVKRGMLAIEEILQGRSSWQCLQVHDSVVLVLFEEDRQQLPAIRRALEESLPVELRRRTEPEVAMKVEVSPWSL